MDMEFANSLTEKMIFFTWKDIYSLEFEDIKQYMIAYASLHDYHLTDKYFTDTEIEDLKETLAVFTLELHVKYSQSIINGDTTDSFIDEVDPIWAYFEYYTIHMSEQDHDIADVLFLDYEDVVMELKSARDAMCMRRDDNTNNHDDIEIDNDDDEDVHMFYPGFEENTNVNEEYREINTMFLNTLQYHKDHLTLQEEDVHRDIMSILGLLKPEEIECTSEKAMRMLCHSADWLAGETRTPNYYELLDENVLRSTIIEYNKRTNLYRPLSGPEIPVGLVGLRKRDIPNMPKEICQMILYRQYRKTSNPLRNTFGQHVTALRSEIKSLVKKIIKKHSLKTNKSSSQSKFIDSNSKNDEKISGETKNVPLNDLPSNNTISDNTDDDVTNTKSKPSENMTSGEPPNSDITINDSNVDISPPTSNGVDEFLSSPILNILPTSTDDEIDRMDISAAKSEYFRLASPRDKNLTIDKVMNLSNNVIYDDLKRFRNVLIQNCDQLTQYHLTADTANDVITKLNRAQCIFALKEYCTNSSVNLDEKYFDSKSLCQIQSEVIQARDALKTKNNTVTSMNKNPTHESNNKAATSNSTDKRATPRELADNMNGVNMSQLDSYKGQPTHDIRGPVKALSDTDTTDNGHDINPAEQTIQTIHAKLETREKNINIPSWIKKLIIQMRKGDPLVMVIPMSGTTYQPSEVIGKETDLPDDEERIKKWVENIRIVNSRLFFTMRIKTVNIDGVKNAVFTWCKGNGRWVDFTRLSSSKIFTGGWFHQIHPFYYNRDDFAQYIFNHLPHLTNKLDIYQKTVYKWSDSKERIITSAVVVDGAFEVKDEALNFLYSHKFTGKYKNVTFVPYKSNEVFTASDQIDLIKSNNVYQQNTARIIIKVRGAATRHHIDGREFSFQDWLHNVTVDKKHVIEGVELAPDDVVRVLFHVDHTDEVTHVIHNLYDHAETVFGSDLTATLLDKANLQRAKTSHDIEKEHSKRLKAINVNANPQGAEDKSTHSKPKQTKARGYYGTYLEVAQANQTQASDITNDTLNDDDDLRKQVRDLAQAQRTMETSMTSTIASVVTTQLQPIHSQINTIQITHQQQVNNFMTIMTNMAKNADKRFESIQSSLSQLGVPAQTPSEAIVSPPGVRT